jgi:hypothetical protein
MFVSQLGIKAECLTLCLLNNNIFLHQNIRVKPVNCFFRNNLLLNVSISLLTTQPFEALRATALLLFMVDSRNFPARRSQKSKRPIPVPMVKMLPLKVTERIPHPLFREGIFLMACNSLETYLINQNYFFKHITGNYFLLFLEWSDHLQQYFNKYRNNLFSKQYVLGSIVSLD